VGPADTDRRNQFNLMATAALHRWVNLGVSLALLSASRSISLPATTRTATEWRADRPAPVTRNTGLGPGSAVLDLRWNHEWRIRPKQKDKSPSLSLNVDAFNVFNRVNYANYMGAISSPFFGSPVSAQPARRMQMGVRVQF